MVRDFKFDGWCARVQLNQLTGPAGTVSVEGRSMAVLVALAERSGEVVSRQELLDRVWGDLFVGEEVVSHAIWDLRRALGDDPNQPCFIHTHRKRGYRLVAVVSWLEAGVGDTGRYRLAERIGGGAMGIVFRARDTRLEREVALKFLPPEWSRDELAKARFLREARTAAALEHPNLCTLLEIDQTDDGRLFLVMPYYTGETLRQALDRGPLDGDRLVPLALQMASGLAALHRLGIVHRDIKPGNILLTEKGEAKILDFGLAKLAGSTRLTRRGSSPGTPAYMSPEQVRGQEAGPASDVWALGATLYEALSGRPPFGAGNEEATFYSILHCAPERLDGAGATEALARVVQRALARSRRNRYVDAQEMHTDLRRVGGEVAAEVPFGSRAIGWRAAEPPPSPPKLSGLPASQPAESPVEVGQAPAEKRRGQPARRAGALMVVALAALAGVAWLLRGDRVRSPEPSLAVSGGPIRVLVPPFENRTEDPALDGVGATAADVVADGLIHTGRVSVTVGGEGSVRNPGEGGLSVVGSFYFSHGELRLRADVVDLATNERLRSLEAVVADRQRPLVAVERLREQLKSVVSIRADTPYRGPGLFSHLPRYDAYQEFWLGISVDSAADADASRRHLQRALELDSDFAMATLYLVGAPRRLVGRTQTEEALLKLDLGRQSLTPFERHLTNAFLNQVRGRRADALLQLRGAAALAPHDPWVNAQITDTALWLNRPLEALEAMEAIPLDLIREPFPRWRRVIDRGYALHVLGRFEEEVEFARRGLELLPNLPTEPRYAEVRGLAAMGRFEELDRAIEASRADVDPIWPESTGWYLLASALQLRAQGRPAEARGYAERAEEACRAVESCVADRVYGWILWFLGRYDEAYGFFARQLADNPTSIFTRRDLACLAALRGDRDEALRLSAEIAAEPTPYFYGAKEVLRGTIEAHLGNLDRAVALIAEGLAAGDNYKEYRVHYHVFLDPLLGYPPYEELVRPRG